MVINITAETIKSDETPHAARFLGPAVGREQWEFSWLPGRVLGRNEAVTAMTIAETVARGLEPGSTLWPFIDGWASKLGLEGLDAVARASEPVQPEAGA
jgi:hypothetical protein